MTMPPTKQLVIMQRLTMQLQAITPANGYDYDLSKSVYRGRGIFGSEPGPFLSILENRQPDPRPLLAGHEKLNRSEKWTLLVQGWAEETDDDSPYPTDGLYQLMGAVMTNLARLEAVGPDGSPLYPGEYRLGRIINDLQIGPGVVRANTPDYAGVQCFYLPLFIGYAINVADPYSLSAGVT